MWQISSIDNLIIAFDQSLRTLFGQHQQTERENPADAFAAADLNFAHQQQVISLLRVDHTGEVCAQALYQGQAITAKNPQLKQKLNYAAQEEIDHLLWCEKRIAELNGRTSYLNPLWYLGSFIIGMTAGMMGDKWSLGFLAETEKQVTQHLEEHLCQLPPQDEKSFAILQAMAEDEKQHEMTALNSGAYELPHLIKRLMKFSAKVMTSTAYYI